ncbi:MAG: UDP-N-acetylmuramoyl-L-alanine--D-glutamate ligase [Alphaproteobacteria bacterium]|nr:UDP-N-acetylmuramoyl-L-alanine--D-glutamate ligase [Alphaproteobacteria bacterium]
MTFINQAFLILGMARSGQATAGWLKNKGATVFTFDDNVLRNQANNGVKNINEIPWDSLTAVIQSPGVSFSFPKPHPFTEKAITHNIPILCDINLLSISENQSKFIGITGTNGKSTTTALIGHILNQNKRNAAVGGNIGIPALSLEKADTYVLELSSFQLEISGSLNLDIGVWLNISEDHLDRHGTMDAYVGTKENIFKGCKSAVISIDDQYSLSVYQKIKGIQPTISVSIKNEADVWVSNGILFEGSTYIMDLRALATLKGVHNQQNAATAYAAVRQYGLSPLEITSALENFPGLEHRLEIVGNIGSTLFVNDSKATNADATACALESYKDYSIYWIAGGRPKSQGIKPLKEHFPKIKHAFLIGEAQDDFAETLGKDVSHLKCENLDNALKAAVEKVNQDKKIPSVILFSPACASFDQFRDFEERGDTFRNLARSMI